MKENIFITGATGMLASHLYAKAKKNYNPLLLHYRKVKLNVKGNELAIYLTVTFHFHWFQIQIPVHNCEASGKLDQVNSHCLQTE